MADKPARRTLVERNVDAWSPHIGSHYAARLAVAQRINVIGGVVLISSLPLYFIVLLLLPRNLSVAGDVGLVIGLCVLATPVILTGMFRIFWVSRQIGIDMRDAGLIFRNAPDVRGLGYYFAWTKREKITDAQVIAVGQQKMASLASTTGAAEPEHKVADPHLSGDSPHRRGTGTEKYFAIWEPLLGASYASRLASEKLTTRFVGSVTPISVVIIFCALGFVIDDHSASTVVFESIGAVALCIAPYGYCLLRMRTVAKKIGTDLLEAGFSIQSTPNVSSASAFSAWSKREKVSTADIITVGAHGSVQNP